MPKYHINPETGEPSICKAKTPQSCKYYDKETQTEPPHFNSKEEGRKHYESMMNKRSLYSQEGFDKSLLNGVNLPENTVSVALTGSHLYNLNTKDSDLDLVAITKDGRTKQTIIDGEDITITPWKEFINRVMNSAPPESLMVASRSILVLDENYRSILESVRFNPYRLYTNLNTYSQKHLNFLYKKNLTEKRRNKTLKTIVRNTVMSDKLLKEGELFTPRLNKEEVISINNLTETALSKFNNGTSYEEMADWLKIDVF